MIRDNIIRASAWRGDACRTAAVWQYDYGLRLVLEGLTLPTAYEVHWTDSSKIPAIVQIGDSEGVAVPDELLTTGRTLIAHVYLHSGDSDGETVKTVTIPVNARASVSEEQPTPAQESAISEAIEALNSGVETVQTIAEGIPETINTALEAAKESGEFDGADGADGAPGRDGVDGVSPTASVTQTATGATVTVTDAQGTTTATLTNGQDGAPGQPGQDGADGVSPTVTITEITGGHRITITDATGSHSADVMDGQGGVTDVQVNGVSVLNQGVANVPVGSTTCVGVFKVDPNKGIAVYNYDQTCLICATATVNEIKAATNGYKPFAVQQLSHGVFYGLAKAAGDSTQSASSNAVGAYTETAKSKISEMLNGPVSVSGTTPTITALPGIRYVCGEVSTLDITLPASGCIDVVFVSGSTPTVLTVTPPTGVTVKWANGFDPSSLDADTTYEINVADGLGVAASWT